MSRLTSTYLLRSLEMMAGLCEGDFLLAIIFMAVTKATVADRAAANSQVDVSETGVLPDSLRRPVSVFSVANSLGLPRETVRRYAKKLVDLGFCERLPDRRLIVTNAILNRPDFREAAARNYREVARLTSELGRLAPGLRDL